MFLFFIRSWLLFVCRNQNFVITVVVVVVVAIIYINSKLKKISANIISCFSTIILVYFWAKDDLEKKEIDG